MASTGSARRLTEQDWKAHEAEIRTLFLEEGLALREVKATIENKYGFSPSDRQWKFRIKRWKLDRSVKRHEMMAIVAKRQHRKVMEPHKPELKFRLRGFNMDSRKILRWMQENKVPVDQLYNGNSGPCTPPDLSYDTDSRQSSPSIPIDVDLTTSESTIPVTSALPTQLDTDKVDTNTQERIIRADEALPPRCWIKTIDLSWAFDTPCQELLDGHPGDQQGQPLGALATALRARLSRNGRTLAVCTLAELFRGNLFGEEQNQDQTQSFRERVNNCWVANAERVALNRSTLLILVHVSLDMDILDGLYPWLEVRFRLGLSRRYYCEGSITFHCQYGPRYNDAILKAIEDEDIDEVKRILSAGEATVFSQGEEYPIGYSARKGNVELTRLLLEHGSPIYMSAKCHFNLIWDIWDGFASRWRRNKQEREFSFDADFSRCRELTALVLKCGAHVDESSDLDGSIVSELNRAQGLQKSQLQQLLQYLFQLGIDKEYRNYNGRTYLLGAIYDYGPNPNFVSALLAMALVILLRADPRFKERPITPEETPRLQELALNRSGWSFWTSVFDKMGWDMEKMNEYAPQWRHLDLEINSWEEDEL
ncbi:hypothetical protein OPT61_g8035 [Boeremia exigua]|uniref:Uncharacterized protein n=1 Tax=Boeremia exigua TaxID=749465 RepID=A0ACC2HZT9_9PLEO|nr:hypothetical protein OPT61_g8035 [Boeremia exigua]